MSMWIDGKIPEEDKEHIKECLSYLIYVGSTEDGDDEDYVDYHKRGWGHIHTVSELWNLVDEQRAKKIYKILKEEIETDNNRICIDEDEESYAYVISIPQIKTMLALMEGFQEALAPIADKYGKVYLDKIKYVQEKEPYLLIGREDAEGNVVYWLDESIWYADTVVWFFKLALKLNREIKLG
jgi:hypothetical protein